MVCGYHIVKPHFNAFMKFTLVNVSVHFSFEVIMNSYFECRNLITKYLLDPDGMDLNQFHRCQLYTKMRVVILFTTIFCI
jgi:hypothetical protein